MAYDSSAIHLTGDWAMFVRPDVSTKAWPYNADRQNIGYMSEGGFEFGKETKEKKVCTHGVVKRISHSYTGKLTGLLDELTLNNLVIAMGGDPDDIESHSGTVEMFHFGEYMNEPYFEVQLISVRGDQKTPTSMSSGTVKIDQVRQLCKYQLVKMERSNSKLNLRALSETQWANLATMKIIQ